MTFFLFGFQNPYKCHLCGKTTKQASNLKSHYLHAHKIKDITSKTIRANARLFQKYKTENLPEAGLLEILSQQVMENLEKQRTDVGVSVVKQEPRISVVASEKLLSRLATEPASPIVDKQQSCNVISDGLDVMSGVKVIKAEKSFDFPQERAPSSSDSIPFDVHDKTLHIKEEVCDSSTVNNEVIPMEETKLKKENKKIRRTSQRTVAKATFQQHIEKVFVDDGQAAELGGKDEVVKQEHRVDEFQITHFNDGVKACDMFRKTLTVKLSRCTADSQSSSAKLNVCDATVPAQQRVASNTFKCDICPSLFKQKIKLKVHMKSHVVTAPNDKRKMCEICGKTYTQNSALKKHLQFTHSNYRPFPCKICGRAFKDSNGLKVSEWFCTVLLLRNYFFNFSFCWYVGTHKIT